MSDHSTDEVQYRLIPGFPAYRVGDDGSVWSRYSFDHRKNRFMDDWKLLKPYKNKRGYITVCLMRDGEQHLKRLHQFILVAFGFERPSPRHVTRHLNGISYDNRLCNLKWGTVKENSDDDVLHGKTNRGERHPMAKVTEEIAMYIFSSVLSNDDLAAKFSVTNRTIRDIRSGRTWRHLKICGSDNIQLSQGEL